MALFHSCDTTAQNMNVTELDKIIRSVGDSIQQNQGSWQLKYKEIWVYVVTDANHNRMRIISPIARVEELEDKHYIKSLEANFHTALDIKYAISEGWMWSIFVHPLKELSAHQVKDAFSQVYSGVATFGFTYSSGELLFPGNE